MEMSSVGMSSAVAMLDAREMSSSDQQRIRAGDASMVLSRLSIVRLREFGFARSGVKWSVWGIPSAEAVAGVDESPMTMTRLCGGGGVRLSLSAPARRRQGVVRPKCLEELRRFDGGATRWIAYSSDMVAAGCGFVEIIVACRTGWRNICLDYFPKRTVSPISCL